MNVNLGYNAEDMAVKFSDVVPNDVDDAVDQLTKNMSHLSRVSNSTQRSRSHLY